MFQLDKIVLTKIMQLGRVLVIRVCLYRTFSDHLSYCFSSTYLVDSCDMWNGKLGYANHSYVNKKIDICLILNYLKKIVIDTNMC